MCAFLWDKKHIRSERLSLTAITAPIAWCLLVFLHATLLARWHSNLESAYAGLCPDWEEWSPNNPVDNAAEAMKLADEWLGVPQVNPSPTACTNIRVTFVS